MAIFYVPGVLLLSLLVMGDLTNHTIDDTFGDNVTGIQVDYSPTSNDDILIWKNVSQCYNCAIAPSAPSAMYNTWTSATYYPALRNITAEMRFHGSAIYIYLILSNYPKSTGLVSDVICDFRVDGDIAGSFRHDTDGSYQFEFNVVAYSNATLADKDHSFLIEISGPEPSYIIFDYAVYMNTEVFITFPAGASSTSSTVRNLATTSLFASISRPPPSLAASSSFRRPFKGAVAGIVVGVLIFIVTITSFFVYTRRQHKKSALAR